MKKIGAYDRVTAVCLFALLLCLCCAASAMASSLPSDLTGSKDSEGALLASASGLDLATGFSATTFSPATGGSGWGSAVESKSAKQKWMTGIAYAAATAGLAATLASAGSGGAKGITSTIIDKTDVEQPIPEPSALILAAVAGTSAFVHLRRRRTA